MEPFWIIPITFVSTIFLLIGAKLHTSHYYDADGRYKVENKTKERGEKP